MTRGLKVVSEPDYEVVVSSDIRLADGVKNLRPKELEEARRIKACGKIMYSRDLVFKGGPY